MAGAHPTRSTTRAQEDAEEEEILHGGNEQMDGQPFTLGQARVFFQEGLKQVLKGIKEAHSETVTQIQDAVEEVGLDVVGLFRIRIIVGAVYGVHGEEVPEEFKIQD